MVEGARMIPSVSVLVSTRDRPDAIAECAKSILANPDSDFELVIVDQSEKAARNRAMAATGRDPRLRWLASDTRGLSVSRNIGVSATHAPLVAFTDDDCRVPPDWVARLRRAFETHRDLGLLFGSVRLPPEDRARGYAAEFVPASERLFQRTLPGVGVAWGVGANMIIRRRVFDLLGTFDIALGVGASFSAAEEIDLTIRALAAGFEVIHTPEFCVVHLGVREGAAASRLMRGYGVGLGATLAKHARIGTPGAASLLAQWVALHAYRSIVNAIHGQRHPGFGLVASVLWGACRSFGKRIDKAQSVFQL